MRKLFQSILFSVCIICSYTASSQELSCENPTPNCFGHNSVFFLDSLQGWIAGERGQISKFEGKSWKNLPHSASTESLQDIYFVNPDHGWAVGNNGTILKIVGGVVTKEVSPTTAALNAVYFVDENNGWAISNSNQILRYSSGVWKIEKAADGTGFFLNDIYMNSSTKGWAVGSQGKIFYYNGIIWQNLSSPVSSALYAVDFTDSTTGYIAGESGVILKYALNKSWVKVNSGLVATLTDIDIVNKSNVWATGQYGSVMHYNGINWSGGGVNGPLFISLQITNKNDGWTITSNGLIYRLRNGVTTVYNSINELSTDLNFKDVSLLNENNGWIITDRGVLLRQKDGLWSKFRQTLPDNNYFGIKTVKDTVAWAIGQWGAIYKFNGLNWTKPFLSFQNEVSSSSLYDISFPDPDNGYIVGSNGCFLKYTSGKWSKISIPNASSTGLGGVFFLNANTGWMCGESGKIFAYKNGIISPMVSGNTTVYLSKIFFIDETEGWAMDNSGTLLHYKNNVWNAETNEPQVLVRDLYFKDKNNGIVVGAPYFNGGGGGAIARYTNGIWAKDPLFYFQNSTINAIDMINPEQGIIVGSGSLILRLGTHVITAGIEDLTAHGNNTNYMAIPNPSSSFIKIYGPGEIDEQQVRISDATGNVTALEIYKVNIGLDISKLKPGFYVAELLKSNTTIKIIKQ